MDDQFATQQAADGAVDARAERLAAHRERARAVLRRQMERIVRLEGLFASLRNHAPPSVESSANAIQKLLEMAERQEAAEERRTGEQRKLVASVNELSDQVAALTERSPSTPRATPVREEKKAAPKHKPAAEAPAGTGWEAAKQRLLAQLEAEGDGTLDNDAAPPEEHDAQSDESYAQGLLSVVARERDDEIAELKRQLQEYQTAGAGIVALDHDERVSQERERLRILQEEWQEKLRKAEIEISIERAKLARERTKVEEQFQSMQKKGRESIADEAAGSKPGKNRWLARLGLLDDEGRK